MTLSGSSSRLQEIVQLRLGRRGLLAGLLAGWLGSSGLADLDAKKKKRKKRKNNKSGKSNKKNSGNSGGYSPDGEERAFLDLINDYRRAKGAGALTLNNNLGAAADYHSRDMAKKNYFNHTLKNGDSAEENIRRFGYTNSVAVGENIAAGFESANDAMKAWKSSPEHDRNMRSGRYTEIGIGRAYSKGSKYGWYWTTTFGDR
ncbi:MAG: CAP domain-containing protein [Thermomicrobiales bacterium]